MQLTNTPSRYGSVTKWLHWSIFVMIFVEFVLGFGVMGVEEGAEVFGRTRASIFNIHATIGLTILGLAAFRLWWRRAKPLPEWSPNLTDRQRKRSHQLETTLYSMMFAKPISGVLLIAAAGIDVAFLGVVDLPALIPENSTLRDVFLTLHILTGVILLVAVFWHVGMGMRHHRRARDRHLNRMLPFAHQ